MSHDVFISYAKPDKHIADAMCHYLEQPQPGGPGIRCWIAPRDSQVGVAFGESIINAIENCKIMVVFSPTMPTSQSSSKMKWSAHSARAKRSSRFGRRMCNPPRLWNFLSVRDTGWMRSPSRWSSTLRDWLKLCGNYLIRKAHLDPCRSPRSVNLCGLSQLWL